MRIYDLTGQKFGRLTAIKNSGRNSHGEKMWECRCDCGEKVYVNSYALRIGHTQSCGCYMRDRTSEATKVHGESKSKLHRTWANMKNRCNNPNYYLYNHYGGKGIKVCAEWDDFIPFRDWALAHGYKDGLSIDRIDNLKGYSPDNCRWATMEQQQNNRTNNRHIIVRGIDKTMAEWAKCGISYGAIQRQIAKGNDASRYIETKLENLGYWGNANEG